MQLKVTYCVLDAESRRKSYNCNFQLEKQYLQSQTLNVGEKHPECIVSNFQKIFIMNYLVLFISFVLKSMRCDTQWRGKLLNE